ncbi:MAG: PQQ-like domain, partial [Armatimonadetes bacterium]|nr:PQQ-like domain [Armatimonadota bacterium]
MSPINRTRFAGSLAVLATMAALVAGNAARAEDWPQFRRDERRTAASPDQLQLPLTDIWSAPGYGLVTWKGRAFYVGASGSHEELVCADLRTGSVLWRRTLAARLRSPVPRDRRAPVAVSPTGSVFVQDIAPGSRIGSLQHLVRAFKAEDGVPIGAYPSPADQNPIPQLVLLDSGLSQERRLAGGMPQPLGPFLVQGDQIAATSLFDQFMRWSPGQRASVTFLAHLFPRRFADPEILPGRLGGSVPVASAGGIVVGGGFGPGLGTGEHQLLALMAGDRCVWHRDDPWGLGIPCVDQNMVFAGAGGINATQAIVAHNAATGAIRWTYAPAGLGGDSFGQVPDAALAARPADYGPDRGFTLTANSQAQRVNPGLVLAGGRLLGVAAGAIVALDPKVGQPVWRKPLGPGESVISLAASREHLLVGINQRAGKDAGGRIVALKLENGATGWSLGLPVAGALALTDGLMFSTDEAVHCFAPAERTFRVAVDSSRREDYALQQASAPVAPAPLLAVAEPPRKEPEATADASVLRLNWGEPVEELVQKARARKALIYGMPLLISLDWLDATRSTIRGAQPAWDPGQIAAFQHVCG